MGTTTPLVSTYALVEELSVFDPPGADAWSEVDAIGVRSEWCSSAETLSRAFTAISHGESGAAWVLLHSGRAVVTVTDMAIAGREGADSELVGHETQQGARIEYTTDAEGRVSVVETDLTGVTDTTTTIVGSVRQQYAWDGLGRLWASTDENSPLTVLDTVTVVHWYDSLGRVIHEAQAISGDSPNALVVRHEYEGATRLVSTTYPDGRVVSRSYDGLDRDILVDDEDVGAPTPDVADTLYVGRSRIALRTYGNGTFLDRRDVTMASTISGTDAGYDANRRDVLIQWRNAGAVPIAGWEYTHDDANMVLTETRRHHLDGMGTPLVDTHTRDSAHRSIAFDRDSGASTPSARVLDGAGKMIEFGDEATAVDVEVDDAMSQYVDLDPNGTPTKPRSYDDLGNLIDDESTRTYSYDAFGRLVFVFEAGPTLAAWYFYDAHDRRVLTVRGTEALQFAYGGDGKVLEERILTSLNAFGDPLRQYVWDETSGRVMQMRTTTRVFVEAEAESDPAPRRGPSASPVPASPSGPLGGEWVKTNSYHYYHHNGRGDVGLVTGVRGGVVEYQVYSWLGRMDVLDENGDPVAGNVSVVGSPWGLEGMRLASESQWWNANSAFLDPRVLCEINPHLHEPIGDATVIRNIARFLIPNAPSHDWVYLVPTTPFARLRINPVATLERGSDPYRWVKGQFWFRSWDRTRGGGQGFGTPRYGNYTSSAQVDYTSYFDCDAAGLEARRGPPLPSVVPQSGWSWNVQATRGDQSPWTGSQFFKESDLEAHAEGDLSTLNKAFLYGSLGLGAAWATAATGGTIWLAVALGGGSAAVTGSIDTEEQYHGSWTLESACVTSAHGAWITVGAKKTDGHQNWRLWPF